MNLVHRLSRCSTRPARDARKPLALGQQSRMGLDLSGKFLYSLTYEKGAFTFGRIKGVSA
jgi:hypothetical protein